MATPLLSTKLHMPPVRPDWVPRPHLVARLNAGLYRKLTLISAPAGSGKTALASAWLSRVRKATTDRGRASDGLDMAALFGLLAASAVLAALAGWRFARRDIRVAGEGGWRLPAVLRRRGRKGMA